METNAKMEAFLLNVLIAECADIRNEHLALARKVLGVDCLHP